MAMPDVDTIRSELEGLHAQLARERYQHAAGLKAEADTAAIHESHRSVATAELIQEMEGLTLQCEGDERRQMKMLTHRLQRHYLDRETALHVDRFHNQEASLTGELDGEAISYRSLEGIIAHEGDRARRARCHALRDRLSGSLIPLARRRWEEVRRAVMSLGYPSYLEFYEESFEFSLASLVRKVEALLEGTDTLHENSFKPWAEAKLGVPYDEMALHDLTHVTTTALHPQSLGQEDVVELATRLTSDLGVDLASIPNIIFDVADRPGKSSRSFCAAVRIPHEVFVVARPHGGMTDLAELLHALGRGLHCGLTSPDLPFEYRFLGDGATSEGFALLLERLASDPRWLARQPALETAPEVVEGRRMSLLYRVRRTCARVLFDLEFHGEEPLRDPEARYADILERTLSLSVDGRQALLDCAPGFECVRLIRAHMFRAHLRAQLVRIGGDDWLTAPEAGEMLRRLWLAGRKFHVEDVLRRAGLEGLDPSFLLADLGLAS